MLSIYQIHMKRVNSSKSDTLAGAELHTDLNGTSLYVPESVYLCYGPRDEALYRVLDVWPPFDLDNESRSEKTVQQPITAAV